MNLHKAITDNYAINGVNIEFIRQQWKIVTGFATPVASSLTPRLEFCQAAGIFGYTGDITGKLSSIEIERAMQVLNKFHNELITAIQVQVNHIRLVKCIQASPVTRINPIDELPTIGEPNF